jgi:hypothetical protein
VLISYHAVGKCLKDSTFLIQLSCIIFKPFAKACPDRFSKFLPNFLTFTGAFISDFAFDLIQPVKDIHCVGRSFWIVLFGLQKVALCMCHAAEQSDILFCRQGLVAGIPIRLHLSFETGLCKVLFDKLSIYNRQHHHMIKMKLSAFLIGF